MLHTTNSAPRVMVSLPVNLSAIVSDIETDSRSFLTQLGDVVQSGVQTVIWAGDADWICNWFGGQAAANAVSFSGQSTFESKPLTSYTVSGAAGGTFKNVDNFSFLRVFGAGHEVPFYSKSSGSLIICQMQADMERSPSTCTPSLYSDDAEESSDLNLMMKHE